MTLKVNRDKNNAPNRSGTAIFKGETSGHFSSIPPQQQMPHKYKNMFYWHKFSHIIY